MTRLEIHAAGRRVWSEIEISQAEFLALTRDWNPPTLRDGQSLDAGEVVLAAGCAAADPAALNIFEQHYLAPARVTALSENRGASADVDDALQQARVGLLIATQGSQPSMVPLLRYAGQGRLRGLVKTVVRRELGKLRDRPQAAANDDLAPIVDATLHALMTEDFAPQRNATKAAVGRAWSALDAQDRLLLQLHHLKGIPVRELGPVYGIHPATVARRIAKARDLLARAVRVAMGEDDPDRAAALRMGFESRLSLSFMGLGPQQ